MEATKPLLTIALLALAMIGILAWEGRAWQCKCGQWLLWVPAARSPHTSQHLADPYSVTHVLHGFLFLAVLYPLRRLTFAWKAAFAMGIEAAWEVLENSPAIVERYRANTAALGYTGDTILNSLGDFLACGLGLLLAKRLGWRWSLWGFFLAEGMLLLWIRDSLLLNVVMLIFPSDTLQQWQAGG